MNGMKKMASFNWIKRLAAFALCLLLAGALLLPAGARAHDGGKTVRVGWYASAFNRTDQYGRRSGYAYEYQRKIAAYTGWNYEYVEGSWPELLRMLTDGEIDLLSDVSFTEERAERMLFAHMPMGTETYHVFVLPGNTEIHSEDYSSLNGKKVGVNQNSIQCDFFRSWAEKNGVQAELLELTCTQEESVRMLQSHELDAYVTLDAFADLQTAAPVWKIGASDFYFAVSKTRPELLAELDAALSRIQDENKYYNQQLYEKHFTNNGTDLYLSAGELEWLQKHGKIRVGYQDNYLAFCASDPATGELIGALKDYLDYASSALVNARLDFDTVAYPTAAAALEAMKNGEVDCVFPANFTEYDAETLGLVMTPPLMRTEMDAVVRAAEQKEFIRKKQVVVAVNEGNTNYDMFLADHYPGWQRAYFKDTPTGLEAVASGGADCVIISNYRFSNIAKQCEKLRLTTVYTGVDMDYYFAARQGDTALYSILARITGIVPDAIVHTALTYYSTEDAKTSFSDLVKDHLVIVMTVIAVVLLVILALLLRSIRAERKAREEEHLVNDLNKRVFVDALTSVRNKGAFDDYIRQTQERLDGGQQIEFAIGVFDCDDLKRINDRYGHDKGDLYLKNATRLICRTFQHSPVFRIGGDEFAVVLENEDFQNRDALIAQFEQDGKALCASAKNEWEEAHLAMGITQYDHWTDRSLNDTLRRADKLMYENKRIRKERERR